MKKNQKDVANKQAKSLIDQMSPERTEALVKYVEEFYQRRHDELGAARNKAFPDHTEHGYKEEDVEYFDAMMSAVIVKCHCGAVLRIDRTFFED